MARTVELQRSSRRSGHRKREAGCADAGSGPATPPVLRDPTPPRRPRLPHPASRIPAHREGPVDATTASAPSGHGSLTDASHEKPILGALLQVNRGRRRGRRSGHDPAASTTNPVPCGGARRQRERVEPLVARYCRGRCASGRKGCRRPSEPRPVRAGRPAPDGGGGAGGGPRRCGRRIPASTPP